jgi:hypothetical protein
MRKILVFILILSGSIYAQNDDEFKIGIALRGGGALYAMGYSSQEMEDFVINVNWGDIFDDKTSRDYLLILNCSFQV